MRRLTGIFKFGPQIYKGFLLVATLLVIGYLFPSQHIFLYQFELNKPWTYPDLYAPYDFVIRYSDEEIERKLDSIKRNSPKIFRKDTVNTKAIKQQIEKELSSVFTSNSRRDSAVIWLNKLIDSLYSRGILNISEQVPDRKLYAFSGKKLTEINTRPFSWNQAVNFLKDTISKKFPRERTQIQSVVLKKLFPDYILDSHYTEQFYREKINAFNPHKKMIHKGELIISKGKKVDKSTYEVLRSFKQTFYEDTQIMRIKLFGLLLISFLLIILLFMYLNKYERDVFENNSSMTMIFLILNLMIASFFVLIKYFPNYIYLLPIIIIPYILKNFFNWRIGFFVSMAAVFIISFGVSDSYEFILLQASASWMAVVGSEDLTKRTKMFVDVGKIVFLYIFMFIAYHMATHGDWNNVPMMVFLLFFINGFLAVALIHELILIFEKFFGLVSDVSLLELQNTNSKLLKKLAEKAPGTFQHSLQVANLAEAVANELNANALLVRVGALYHDVGKMKNPKYFTENQIGDYNPHDELTPEKSAEIIINHVIEGIEMARRNGLPEKVIDFIRTHHGTDIVQYFYEKAKENDPDVEVNKFRYPGPNPFSKETAIVMMADSVEAASKSLKNPTKEEMDSLVDKIIDRKVQMGLLNNAQITMREISEAKKVLKNKLRSIHHLRVEYPESIFDKNPKKL